MKHQTQIAEFNNAWKGRGNLSNLVAELERQKASRFDFVADTRHFDVRAEDGKVMLHPKSAQAGEWLTAPALFNDAALDQLAEKCEPSVPKKFFDKLNTKKHGERLSALINGLHDDTPVKRLVRCLDGKVRAWLSDSYRVIDNFDMAFTCLDQAKRQNAEVIEASLSDTSMRIKFTTRQVYDVVDTVQRSGPQGGWFAGAIGNKELLGKTVLGARVTNELPGGPGTVHPIVTVSNSETGHGGFHVRIGILMGICYNVATLEDVVSQVHLGSRLEEGIFTAETRSVDSKAIMLKARDAVMAAFDQQKFRLMVAKAKTAQKDEIAKPTAAVDCVVEFAQLNDENKEALLEYFLRDYQPTRFGLAQAVGRLAQDTEDGDVAFDLEKLAGHIINTPTFINA